MEVTSEMILEGLATRAKELAKEGGGMTAGQNWFADDLAYLPNNPHNRRRVKRAVAIAATKEGQEVSPQQAIRCGADGNLRVYIEYARVARRVRRLLLHDWQQGLLAGVPPMKFPALLYRHYFVEFGSLGQESGYLHPDGTKSKSGTYHGQAPECLSDLDIFK